MSQAIVTAVRLHKYRKVRRMLYWGARGLSDTRDCFGRPLLSVAADTGDTAMVELLIGAGANVAATGPDGRNPLHMACDSGHDDTILMILASVSEEAPPPRRMRADSAPAAAAGAQAGADSAAAGEVAGAATPPAAVELHPLRRRATGSSVQLVATAGGAAGDTEPAAAAAAAGPAAAGAGVAASEAAAAAGAQALAEARAEDSAQLPTWRRSFDAKGNLPVHYAAKRSARCLAALLANGEPPDGRTKVTRVTPLLIASRQGHLDSVRLLLGQGADPNLQDRSLHTPLHVAAAEGHACVVRALLRAGASPSLTDWRGKTPLQVARLFHKHEAVEVLLHERGRWLREAVDWLRSLPAQDTAGRLARLVAARRGAGVAALAPAGRGGAAGSDAAFQEALLRLSHCGDMVCWLVLRFA